MDTLRQDVRAAWATMRRSPGFTATALVTLALGIGATTAVFTIVRGILLRPLPYSSSDRLVRVWEVHPGGTSPAGNRWLNRSTYAVWREQTATLEALGGYTVVEYPLTFGATGIKMLGARVSPALLDTLDVAPALGRFLIDTDDREGAPPIVIISDQLWRERYAASPQALGASLTIDGEIHTIVGVAPRGLDFPDPRVRYWLPYVIPRSPTATAGAWAVTAVARVKSGVTLIQVEAEGTTIARAAPKHRLTEFFFGKGGAPVVHVRRLGDDIAAPARPALVVLAVAVALVLLIACANVTNLLLSRGLARQRELAIRGAIGGSRGRIVRQLFTESAVFSIAGSALGLLLAWWLVDVLHAIAPPRLPRLESVTLDRSVLLFWALATILATIAAGLAPAIRGSRVALSEALSSADRSSSAGFRGSQSRHLRDGLLVVEAAFAVILIVGATLLARTFVRLINVDNGYTADSVLVATIEMPRNTADTRIDQTIDTALTRVRSLPDVSAAGAAAMIPLTPRTAIVEVKVPETASGGKPNRGRALLYWITPGYAEALNLRLRQGRLFHPGDERAHTLTVIINQEFVRQHLNVPNAIGLRLPGFLDEGKLDAEIVGVVGDVLKDGNDRQPAPEMYVLHGAHGQRIGNRVSFVIRATGDPGTLAPPVRALLSQIAPEAVIDRIQPLSVDLAASLDAPRFAASIVGSFALLAVVLAAIGLYGVLSYSVSQRLRELAIRSALGAQRLDLLRLVLREGLSVTTAGSVLGVLGASLFTRLMQDLLFGVTALDPVTFTVAPLVLAIVSLGACLGPALRAAATDPAITLRS